MVQGSVPMQGGWIYFDYEKIRALEGLSFMEHAIVRSIPFTKVLSDRRRWDISDLIW